MIPTAHRRPQPKRISIGSAVFAHMTAERPIRYSGMPRSQSKLPLPMGDLDPHLILGSLGPPKSSIQTASRSVQPFLQGSLVWQTDRPTDHATLSVTIGRIYMYVRSTAMRPEKGGDGRAMEERLSAIYLMTQYYSNCGFTVHRTYVLSY